MAGCSGSAWKTTGACPTSIFVEMETCRAGLALDKYWPFFASVESPATQTSNITTAALAQIRPESFPLGGGLPSFAVLFTWFHEEAGAKRKRQTRRVLSTRSQSYGYFDCESKFPDAFRFQRHAQHNRIDGRPSPKFQLRGKWHNSSRRCTLNRVTTHGWAKSNVHFHY